MKQTVQHIARLDTRCKIAITSAQIALALCCFAYPRSCMTFQDMHSVALVVYHVCGPLCSCRFCKAQPREVLMTTAPSPICSRRRQVWFAKISILAPRVCRISVEYSALTYKGAAALCPHHTLLVDRGLFLDTAASRASGMALKQALPLHAQHPCPNVHRPAW